MSRPVYVPKQKRRKAAESRRLHGAFTGGFSAGYFNTVGSAEGWKPSENDNNQNEDTEDNNNNNNNKRNIEDDDGDRKKRKQKTEQRLEDFMDEQDHNEWGGPLHLKDEYRDDNDKKPRAAAKQQSSDVAFLDAIIINEPPANIGVKLLKHLGWRGNDTVYVSTKNKSKTNESSKEDRGNNDEDDEEQRLLSARSLRKIKLQQKRVPIPIPKLDTTGLGYSSFEHAPEFKEHKERRLKLAQQRVTALHDKSKRKNVYRISDVMQQEDTKDYDDDEDSGKDVNHHNLAYQESIEDFVGTKTVGGFALDDDADDAYDSETEGGSRMLVSRTGIEKDTKKKISINKEAYETVAYEHDDSDPEDTTNGGTRTTAAKDFGTLLSSWATGDVADYSKSESTTIVATTADGRPPLAGFVLGGSGQSQERFRGPDVPSDYQVKPHVFGKNDHPLILQALNRAEQLELADERRKEAFQDALDRNAAANAPKAISVNQTMQKNNVFAGISTTMKSRFVSETKTTEIESSRPAGLSHINSPGLTAKESDEKAFSKPTEDAKLDAPIQIKRTVLPFAPNALLCKRFHIRVPALQNIHIGAEATGGPSLTGEQAHFYDELKKRADIASQNKVNENKLAKETQKKEFQRIKDELLSDVNAESTTEDSRPAMSVYKSVFDPESESSDDSSIDKASEENLEKDENGDDASLVAQEPENPTKLDGNSTTGKGQLTTSEDRLVPYEAKEKRKHRKHRKKHKKRSRSWSSDDESTDDESRASRSSLDDSEDDSSRERRRRKKHDRKKKHREHREKKKNKKKRKKHRKRVHDSLV